MPRHGLGWARLGSAGLGVWGLGVWGLAEAAFDATHRVDDRTSRRFGPFAAAASSALAGARPMGYS